MQKSSTKTNDDIQIEISSHSSKTLISDEFGRFFLAIKFN